MTKKKLKIQKSICFLVILTIVTTLLCLTAYAAAPGVSINLDTTSTTGGALGTIEILFLMVLIALAPSILLMMTSFTRIVIVLSFLRNALGTQQAPPNQIIIGMSLMLSLFVMSPVMKEINDNAYTPYTAGTITQEEAVSRAVMPIKTFMVKQTDSKEFNLFLSVAGQTLPDVQNGEPTIEQFTSLGLEIIIPSFITSELKRAFTMGFLLFIPFLVIDIVVSSTLMSMGMVMLPPSMIALPFKLMMFVLVDGWSLLFSSLVRSFR